MFFLVWSLDHVLLCILHVCMEPLQHDWCHWSVRDGDKACTEKHLDHICNYFTIDIVWFNIASFVLNSETDQLYKICTVLGTPDCRVWPEGMNLPRSSSFKFFQVKLSSIWSHWIKCFQGLGLIVFPFWQIPPRNLWELIPNASLEAIDLIQVHQYTASMLFGYEPKFWVYLRTSSAPSML